MNNDKPLVSVRGLKKYFPVKGGILSRTCGYVKAVDGVDIDIRHGHTVGLVGESGCGKSTTGRCMLRLIEPTSGSISFDGVKVENLSRRDLRRLRSEMQIVFQDPYASLNPRLKIGDTLAEPFAIHNIGSKQERDSMVLDLLGKVGLPSDCIKKYPHEFSGGQRQRIGIARAIALKPKFLLLDEPVSALDVSIQAQVINLLTDLKNEFGMSYLFISHDLSVIEKMCDELAVMYLGKIVETGTADEIFESPLHPYTEALISATPVADPKNGTRRIVLKGDVPSPADPPSGCVFHPRCSIAEKKCSESVPLLLKKTDGGRQVACHLR